MTAALIGLQCTRSQSRRAASAASASPLFCSALMLCAYCSHHTIIQSACTVLLVVCSRVQRGELPLDRARSPQLRSLLHSAAQVSNGPVTTDEEKSDRSAGESDADDAAAADAADGDDDEALFSPSASASSARHRAGNAHSINTATANKSNSISNGNGTSSSNSSSSTKAATDTRASLANGEANGANGHSGARPAHSRRHDPIGKKHSFYK